MERPRSSSAPFSRKAGTSQSLGTQGEGGADLGPLLAGHPGEGPQAPLALQVEHALVELPGEHHVRVQSLDVRGG